MISRLIAVTLFGMTLLNATLARGAHEFFDFEPNSPMHPVWYPTQISATPIGQRHFLGPFGNQRVLYSLMDVIDPNLFHGPQPVLIEFDLFVIGDWSGNDSSGASGGADHFELSVSRFDVGGEQIMLSTSFSNLAGLPQAYPGDFPDGSFLAGTGSLERGTLGYGVDAVYHIRRSILTHASPNSGDLAFYFTVSGLQQGATWGLDNVDARWITIPEPATFTLAALTAIGLLASRRSRTQWQRVKATIGA